MKVESFGEGGFKVVRRAEDDERSKSSGYGNLGNSGGQKERHSGPIGLGDDKAIADFTILEKGKTYLIRVTGVKEGMDDGRQPARLLKYQKFEFDGESGEITSKDLSKGNWEAFYSQRDRENLKKNGKESGIEVMCPKEDKSTYGEDKTKVFNPKVINGIEQSGGGPPTSDHEEYKQQWIHSAENRDYAKDFPSE